MNTTRHPVLKRRLLVLLAVMAIFAASCGGSDDDSTVAAGSASSNEPESSESAAGEPAQEPEEDLSGDEPTDEAADTGPSVEEGGTSMAASSPIGAFFADDGGFEAAIAEYTIRVEESIVVCMANEGFEFAVSGGGFQNNPVQDSQSEMTVREWTTEFGFGISTSFDSIAQNQAADPNSEIFFGMSEAEREVWVETLTGGGLDGFGGPGDDTPLEEQGCIGQALIETGGQDAIEGLEVFGEAYEEGEEALFERREMVDAVDAWTRCMSEAGFPNYATLDDPEDEISERLDAVTAPMNAALDLLTDEEGQALVSGESLDIADLPDLDVSALRELQKEEIALALVDLDCYEAEVQQTFEPLLNDFENGLLTEYATEFDALRNIGG